MIYSRFYRLVDCGTFIPVVGDVTDCLGISFPQISQCICHHLSLVYFAVTSEFFHFRDITNCFIGYASVCVILVYYFTCLCITIHQRADSERQLTMALVKSLLQTRNPVYYCTMPSSVWYLDLSLRAAGVKCARHTSKQGHYSINTYI